MKILVIDGHPDPDPARFCHALAGAYVTGAGDAGHDVRRIDVASLEFPLLRSAQEFKEATPPPAIRDAQDAVLWAEHLVLIYPLWLGTQPALLKGFLEQLFRPDFAFEPGGKGWPQSKLKGRSARVIVTMGMPAFAYCWIYGAHSLKSLERNILKFVGLGPIRETLFGSVEAVDAPKREKWLKKVRGLGRDGA